MNRRYALKNKRRFYLFMIIVIITVSSSALAAGVQGADTDDRYISVVVETGDTLWDLAREYKTSGDLRQYIREVEKINNLTDSLIYEGDVLKMPV